MSVQYPTSFYNVSFSVGSGDCLVMFYPLLLKFKEKGARLPVIFPQTICYEHHFPRGWYYFESAETAVTTSKEKTKKSSAPSPVKHSLTSEWLLQRHKEREEKGSNVVVAEAIEVPQEHVLVRRAAKECDSTSIFNTFSGRKRSPIGCQVITRAANGAIDVRYFDDSRLEAFLYNSPEQCILSRFLLSKRSSNDVVIATWTPSVFSIEHRCNNNQLKDRSLSAQQRGDTSLVVNYTEIQTCPLLAAKVRESIQRLVWLVQKYEKKNVLEFRCHFKQDANRTLYLLWVEVLRIVPFSKPTMPLSPSDVWEEYEQQQKEQKAREHARATKARQVVEVKGERKRYGAWPSFCKDESLTVELLLEVEDKLSSLLNSSADQTRPVAYGDHKKGKMEASLPVTSPSRRLEEVKIAPTLIGSIPPALPLLLNNDEFLHVNFKELEVREKPRLRVGYIAPPSSPRAEEETELSGAAESRNAATKSGDSVPLAVQRLKSKVVARRDDDGPSQAHLSALQESRFTHLEGHLADSFLAQNANSSVLRSAVRSPHSASSSLNASLSRHSLSGYDLRSVPRQSGGSKPLSKPHQESRVAKEYHGMSLEEIEMLKGLDVMKRVEHNQLQRHHVEILNTLEDLGYELYSASLKTFKKSVIPFDFPPQCPLPPIEVLRDWNVFYLAEIDPALSAVTAETYCLVREADRSVLHIFTGLHQLVQKQCRAVERAFLEECKRNAPSEASDTDEASAGASPVIHEPPSA